jgi:tetratricopeptide (TPR) repeat protein
VMVMLQFAAPVLGREMTAEEKEKKRQEILEQIRKKQAKKADTKKDLKKVQNKNASNQNIAEVIRKYENYLDGSCKTQKSSRCADALFSVSKLYYTKAREDYIKNQEYYEKAMDKYDRNPVGPEPIAPIPNYDLPLQSYEKAIEEYPNFAKVGEAYFQAGSIYMLRGDLEKASFMYEELVKNKPNDIRAAAAHFRIAEICFTDRNYSCALENLNAMNEAHINDAIREMAHFRKGEIYYNRGDFDMSAKLFGEYIDKCDRLEFPKRDLRPEAMEYLAVSFSDMDNGAQKALDYFNKLGNRSYEDTITYAVGMKNYDHGQYEAAILALSRAIEKFPYYEDAPRAQMNIVNSYVIRKKHEDANKEREKLVDNYGTQSIWAQRNAENKVAVAKADIEVKKALGTTLIHYHRKLFTTIATDIIIFSFNTIEQHLSNFLQCLITLLVSVVIIVLFEVIHINHEERHRIVISTTLCNRQRQHLIKIPAIEQTCECIANCQFFQIPAGLFQFEIVILQQLVFLFTGTLHVGGDYKDHKKRESKADKCQRIKRRTTCFPSNNSSD